MIQEGLHQSPPLGGCVKQKAWADECQPVSVHGGSPLGPRISFFASHVKARKYFCHFFCNCPYVPSFGEKKKRKSASTIYAN